MSLIRTRVGNFKIEDAGKFIELEDILDVAKINISEHEKFKFINGVSLESKENDGLVKIYCNEKFIGIGEIKDKKLKRKIVIE